MFFRLKRQLADLLNRGVDCNDPRAAKNSGNVIMKRRQQRKHTLSDALRPPNANRSRNRAITAADQRPETAERPACGLL